MEEKRELTRGQVARLLGVGYSLLRYYEDIGKFRPVRTKDQYGQVVALYSPPEVEKVRSFFAGKDMLYKTEYMPR